MSEVLFTKTQRRVLGLLFGNSQRSYYANEIVRHAQAGIGAVQRELGRLVAAGLLTVSRVGNQKHYQANRQAPIFDELEAIVLKTVTPDAGAPKFVAREMRARYAAGREESLLSVPRRKLEATCRRYRVKRLGVFGSAARGDATGSSDIDLLVEFEKEASVSLFDMVHLQEELSHLFGRKVDLATPAILENPYRRRSVLKDLRELYAA